MPAAALDAMNSISGNRKLSGMEEQKVLQWSMGPSIEAQERDEESTYFEVKRVFEMAVVVM